MQPRACRYLRNINRSPPESLKVWARYESPYKVDAPHGVHPPGSEVHGAV